MNQFSHRKFLYTAGISAASIVFLKSCAINPPTATENNNGEKQSQKQVLGVSQK
ncbi:MAG: hypothetical protein AAF298_25555 [Cyanobacteria bacterium P01_A01_bin.40]